LKKTLTSSQSTASISHLVNASISSKRLSAAGSSQPRRFNPSLLQKKDVEMHIWDPASSDTSQSDDDPLDTHQSPHAKKTYLSLPATHLKTTQLGKTSGKPNNQLNHTTMLDHSKTKLSSRRGSAQSSNLKFHLTCTSDDEQSLERIHTFNLKTASFDAK
jgi:hypothetical protein